MDFFSARRFLPQTPYSLQKPVTLLLCALLFLLSGCALLDKKPLEQHEQLIQKTFSSGDVGSADVNKNYWWRVAAHMHWPQQQPTAWYIDALLAHQVFKPELIQHAENIHLWRFHRRAVRDSAGHRFSFIFYSTRPVAQVILNKLTGHSLLQELLDAGVVEKINLFEINQDPKSAVEATSDKSWSLPMQRSWPFFAVGISQLWLGLIDHHVAAMGMDERQLAMENDLDELTQYYQQIESKIDATWKNEGRHALLHHLNAMFGYDEVVVYEKKLMQF